MKPEFASEVKPLKLDRHDPRPTPLRMKGDCRTLGFLVGVRVGSIVRLSQAAPARTLRSYSAEFTYLLIN